MEPVGDTEKDEEFGWEGELEEATFDLKCLHASISGRVHSEDFFCAETLGDKDPI